MPKIGKRRLFIDFVEVNLNPSSGQNLKNDTGILELPKSARIRANARCPTREK